MSCLNCRITCPAELSAHKIPPGKPENSLGIPHSNQSILTGITLVYSNPENTGRCLFNWSLRFLHKFDGRLQVEIFERRPQQRTFWCISHMLFLGFIHSRL